MTLSEFKAWFEGFTETLEGPPNAKQWKRIQARVKEISGQPITERVYIDRYRDYFRSYLAYGVGTCEASDGVGVATFGKAINNTLLLEGKTVEQDSQNAMRFAGRAESLSVS